MFFSKLTIHVRPNSLSQKGIYSEHQFLWNLFPGDPDANRDFLFRKIDSEISPTYYLVSQRKPVASDSGILIESKTFDPKIKSGDILRFSLRANATVTKKVEGRESEKRKRDDVFMEALAKNRLLPKGEKRPSKEVLTEAGSRWLISRSESAGFAVLPASLFVEGYRRLDGIKNEGKHRIQIGAIDYSGILEVTDADRFKQTLRTGIGKSKAFGCGLLLIRKI